MLNSIDSLLLIPPFIGILITHHFYRCLDETCPLHKSKTLAIRSQFFRHALKKSTCKIRYILMENNIVDYEQYFSRLTLINLLTDFSTEPIATRIINGDEI